MTTVSMNDDDLTVGERLVRIETKLDTFLAAKDDHERRIRVLEASRWPLPSLALLVALGSATLGALQLIFGG